MDRYTLHFLRREQDLRRYATMSYHQEQEALKRQRFTEWRVMSWDDGYNNGNPKWKNPNRHHRDITK